MEDLIHLTDTTQSFERMAQIHMYQAHVYNPLHKKSLLKNRMILLSFKKKSVQKKTSARTQNKLLTVFTKGKGLEQGRRVYTSHFLPSVLFDFAMIKNHKHTQKLKKLFTILTNSKARSQIHLEGQISLITSYYYKCICHKDK